MRQIVTTHPPISAIVWPETSLPRNVALGLGGALLIAVSAKVHIPVGPAVLFPLPVTLQTLAVLGVGTAYGWRLGGTTLLVYLSLGALGLPVFAGGGGVAHLWFAETAGYLYGFLFAATFIGWLAERGADRRPMTLFPALLAANGLIYLCGVMWLAAFIGMERAAAIGFTPFLFADVLKCASAALIFPLAWKFVDD